MTDNCNYINQLLLDGIERDASDIHLTELSEPFYRIDGELVKLKGCGVLDIGDMNRFLDDCILAGYHGTDGDFSFTFGERRWRGNFFYSNSKKLSIALRILPMDVPSIEMLDLPESFKKVVEMKNGIVLLTGPTGSGKSTTIAAMIKHVLERKSVHLITIENPVEYLFEGNDRSLVNQREIGGDTPVIADALKYALRQDPDVILVGEIRDKETARLAVDASETGHLVFATLHTVSVAETVNRLLGLFAADEQHLVQQQIASVLNLIVAQTLVKKPGGGRRAAVEALFPNEIIRNLIRHGKVHEMPQYYEQAEYINTIDFVEQKDVSLGNNSERRVQDRRKMSTSVIDVAEERRNGNRRGRESEMENGVALPARITDSCESTTDAVMIKKVSEIESIPLLPIEPPVNYPLVAVEAPAEHLFEDNDSSLADQREIVGVIRDKEVACPAVDISKEWHLLVAMRNAVAAAETLHRLLRMFTLDEQYLVQQQTTSVFDIVVARTLVKKPGDGRKAAVEAFVPNNIIRGLIQYDKAHEIPKYYNEAEYINTLDLVEQEDAALENDSDRRLKDNADRRVREEEIWV